VIGAVLRPYNDAVDDTRRQDLYGCAATVLGSRAPDGVERARAAQCLLAIDDLRESHQTSWWWRVSWGSRRSVVAMRASMAHEQPAPVSRLGSFVGEALAAARGPGHARLLSLVDELVAIGPGLTAPGADRRTPAIHR
jgi:hypothetical protein